MIVFSLISIGLFFWLNIIWTQRIYAYDNFLKPLLLSFILPAGLFFLAKNNIRFKTLNVSLIPIFYFVVLFAIRKSYKELNTFLVNSKLIDSVFASKEFTLVQFGSEFYISDSWDESLVAIPSWLDYVLSFGILTLPLIMEIPILYFTKTTLF